MNQEEIKYIKNDIEITNTASKLLIDFKIKEKERKEKREKMKKWIILIILIFISLMMLFTLTGCNKQIIDTNYTFNKAITYIGNERIEIQISKWNDYDGEQIQVIAKDRNSLFIKYE